MNKKLVLAAGLMTLMASLAEGGSCSSSAATCEKTSAAVAVSTEEASFAAKLSEQQATAFNEMSADERLEVLTAAEKQNLTPDAAVDQFMNKHEIALVEGELKTVEVN